MTTLALSAAGRPEVAASGVGHVGDEEVAVHAQEHRSVECLNHGPGWAGSRP